MVKPFKKKKGTMESASHDVVSPIPESMGESRPESNGESIGKEGGMK